jgi:hypothetical protein
MCYLVETNSRNSKGKGEFLWVPEIGRTRIRRDKGGREMRFGVRLGGTIFTPILSNYSSR